MTVDFRAVPASAHNFDIAAAELGGFEDRLAAAAARGADDGTSAADDCDAHDFGEAEPVLRGGERALL